MYKIIDVNKWNRKSTYEWFKTFFDPTYGFNVKLDVTNIVNYSKETKTSFFINFLFILMISFNEIEAMRLRIVNDEVRLYDSIQPDFTVMNQKLGTFDNCSSIFSKDYNKFYTNAHEVIEKVKNEAKIKENYNSDKYFDRFYITCIPWLSLEAMTHPTGVKDLSSTSVPRICWDKYQKVGEKYFMTLNVTVSHVLVDGEPLSDAFNNLIDKIEHYEIYLKS